MATPAILAAAIAEQEEREASAPLPAAVLCADRALLARIKASSYRMGRAVLAYCDANPAACDGAEHVVAALRDAMQNDELIAGRLVDVWAHVPGAADVRAEGV